MFCMLTVSVAMLIIGWCANFLHQLDYQTSQTDMYLGEKTLANCFC